MTMTIDDDTEEVEPLDEGFEDYWEFWHEVINDTESEHCIYEAEKEIMELMEEHVDKWMEAHKEQVKTLRAGDEVTEGHMRMEVMGCIYGRIRKAVEYEVDEIEIYEG